MTLKVMVTFIPSENQYDNVRPLFVRFSNFRASRLGYDLDLLPSNSWSNFVHHCG